MHDFDFLLGQWDVENQRLTRRLQGGDEWETFNAIQSNQALPAGIGNYDDFIAADWRPGFVGLSLRLFNPQTQFWSIYWLDNRSGGLQADGLLQPPVVGQFADGVGIFEGGDMLDDRPIRVRYTWRDVDTATPSWEQAMSADAGLHWEVNWRMRFRRRAA